MEMYRTKPGMYSAWNYELEIEDLNKASEEGWQLEKGGSFSHKYRWSPDIQYRYQLDFQPNIENMGRYMEIYREQGWEYINSTFNGWHYFRKIYDPALPEEQYEIFTDMTSLNEMNRRWSIIATVLSSLMGVYVAVQVLLLLFRPKLPYLVGALTTGIVLAIFIRAIRIMKNPDGDRKQRKDGWILLLLFLSLLVGPIVTVTLLDSRPRMNTMFYCDEYHAISSNFDEGTQWQSFFVSYPDFYYVDFYVTSEKPFQISIVDETMEQVYSAEVVNVLDEEKRIWLDKGIYDIYFTDFSGGSIDVEFRME